MKHIKTFENTKNENTKYFIIKLEHNEMFDNNYISYYGSYEPAYVILKINETINLKNYFITAHIMFEYVNEHNYSDRSREIKNNITSFNINKLKDRIICYTKTYGEAMKNLKLILQTNKFNL